MVSPDETDSIFQAPSKLETDEWLNHRFYSVESRLPEGSPHGRFETQQVSRGVGVGGGGGGGWGQIGCSTQTPDPNLSLLCGESSTSALLQTFVRRLRSNSRSHSYVSPVVWRIFCGESSATNLPCGEFPGYQNL